jgi:hypothetical protein
MSFEADSEQFASVKVAIEADHKNSSTFLTIFSSMLVEPKRCFLAGVQ